jgi:hypothetical protein
MRKLIPVLALAATVISAPAFAQPAHYAPHRAPAVHSSSDPVTYRGTVRGQDPDPYVRLQILRDAEAGHL